MKSLGSFLAVVILSTCASLPVALAFPPVVGPLGSPHHIEILLLGLVLVFDAVALAIAVRKSSNNRNRFLRNIGLLAIISITASFPLYFDVRIPVLKTPHVLAPLLSVDGEYAYDADLFELYCELWILIAGCLMIATILLSPWTSATRDGAG